MSLTVIEVKYKNTAIRFSKVIMTIKQNVSVQCDFQIVGTIIENGNL